jgi:hypothetical protein
MPVIPAIQRSGEWNFEGSMGKKTVRPTSQQTSQVWWLTPFIPVTLEMKLRQLHCDVHFRQKA